MRRIFSSSPIRLTRVWRRPAVSIRIGSRPRARPAWSASKTTAAGSEPLLARIMSTPARWRPDLELLHRRGAERVRGTDQRILPCAFSARASFPTVVVLPVPLTPTIITTRGGATTTAGVSARRRIVVISSFTSDAQALAAPGPAPTALTMACGRADADVGRDQDLLERLEVSIATLVWVRASGASACWTTSSNR
jgi:hypothetical protein